MVMFTKIRRMHFCDRLLISEITRRSSLTWNTHLESSQSASGVKPRYAREPAETNLTLFEQSFLKAPQTDAYRPKRNAHTAQVLFQELLQVGSIVTYSRVTRCHSAMASGHGRPSGQDGLGHSVAGCRTAAVQPVGGVSRAIRGYS